MHSFDVARLPWTHEKPFTSNWAIFRHFCTFGLDFTARADKYRIFLARILKMLGMNDDTLSVLPIYTSDRFKLMEINNKPNVIQHDAETSNRRTYASMCRRRRRRRHRRNSTAPSGVTEMKLVFAAMPHECTSLWFETKRKPMRTEVHGSHMLCGLHESNAWANGIVCVF